MFIEITKSTWKAEILFPVAITFIRLVAIGASAVVFFCGPCMLFGYKLTIKIYDCCSPSAQTYTHNNEIYLFHQDETFVQMCSIKRWWPNNRLYIACRLAMEKQKKEHSFRSNESSARWRIVGIDSNTVATKKKYAKRRTIMRTHKTIGTKHTETTLILDWNDHTGCVHRT